MIYIGSDHGGFELKEKIRKLYPDFIDCGTHSASSCDYPEIAKSVCSKMGKDSFGILICGTGIGMSIQANRYPNVRAALATTPDIARLARDHNDANILCLGGRFIDEKLALEIVKTFLETPFSNEDRHNRRIEMIGL